MTFKERKLLEFVKEFVKDLGGDVEPVFTDPVGSVGPIKAFLAQTIDECEKKVLAGIPCKLNDKPRRSEPKERRIWIGGYNQHVKEIQAYKDNITNPTND